ncbi:hypothetical protein [Aliiroseovarius lamellibrachiae]|uniref:hypothetical protein n=1 Tax=Aliiroseovarius lamellibrachiae TaxID=1924933 RepID=UPI001BE0E543|nr:hypothetical protein [Aliiroseovarius lamellibrachiae]
MVLKNRNNRGFALIVVLSMLSVITFLVAGTTTRVVSRATDIDTEKRIMRTAHETAALLSFAIAAFGSSPKQIPPSQKVTVPWQDDYAELRLQDVAGLIDLNTADTALVETFVSAMGLPSSVIDTLQVRRSNSQRLESVGELPRVVGMPIEDMNAIAMFATVHSGRRGLALDVTPEDLIEALGGRDHLQSRFQQSKPSGAVYLAIVNGDGKDKLLGVVLLSQGVNPGTILEIY